MALKCVQMYCKLLYDEKENYLSRGLVITLPGIRYDVNNHLT
jgi:hypothetical protein